MTSRVEQQPVGMPLTVGRRRVAQLTFSSLGAYAYCLYALGPILVLLRRDLHASYTVTSLHSALWAAGSIVTGFSYDRLARRSGRRALLWASALGTAAGALMFLAGYTVGVTLAAAGVLGTAGTFLQTGTSAVVADAYGQSADVAFVSMNMVGSAVAVATPVVFAVMDATAGWRLAMLVPVVALGIVWLRHRGDALPPSEVRGDHGERLPAAYWVAAILVAAVVAIEFCLVLHGGSLLHDRVGLSARDAATALSLFLVAELLGRIAGRRLTRVPGRTSLLTGAALAVTAVGAVTLWAGRTPAVALTGLFIAGLGVANLYPLTLALAIRAAPGRTDAATARVQVAVGVALLTAPLALGALADHVGVARAYAVEPALIVLAGVLLIRARRS